MNASASTRISVRTLSVAAALELRRCLRVVGEQLIASSPNTKPPMWAKYATPPSAPAESRSR